MAKPSPPPKTPTINLQWYEDLTVLAPVGIFFADARGNCLQVNRKWCEIAGLSPGQAAGSGWLGAIHPEDLERVAALWHDSVGNNRPFHAEYRFRTPGGKTTWVLGRAMAKLAGDGSVEGYIGTITDIDQTRQALEKLELSSARIRTIIAHMPVILFAFDRRGCFCAWNNEAERVTGYSAVEMVGNPQAMQLLCPDPEYRRAMLDAYNQSGNDFRDWEWHLTASDGTVKTIAFSSIAKYYPIKGWASWGVGVDVTVSRRTEHQLRERVKELGCLFKISMLSNRPGLDLDEFFQGTVALLPESWQYPDITSARIIYEDRIFTTEPFAASAWTLASELHVRGRKAGLIEIYYREERPAEAEGPFLLEERLLLDEIALQVSRTISQVLARQDLALLDEISAKAEQLENFSHTISHDLKTPLTAIGGFAEFLGKQLNQGNLEQAHFCTERIVENTRRMERRLGEILNLAKIGRIIDPSDEIDLQRLIDETLAMLARQLTEAHIKVEMDTAFPRVVGDAVRLREVIENLLENAIRYIGDEPNLINIGCRRQGGETVLYVRDNGIGIDARHFDSIFELFRRLDSSIHGDGVGLAVSKRIVEAHGGRIWVESEGEGKGSCFCFTLSNILD